MSRSAGPSLDNLLIRALPLAEQQRLLVRCERVRLDRGDVLQRPGERFAHALFPAGAVISLLRQLEDGAELEVAKIGIEGLYGATIAIGALQGSLLAIVHTGGEALRLSVVGLQSELRGSPGLVRMLHRQLANALVQMARHAGCCHFHRIEQRLARWLLESRDCAATNELQLTHEYMARMLGVRRVGVTNAAHLLQRAGLIRYQRGRVEIVEGAALATAACSCYRAARAP